MSIFYEGIYTFKYYEECVWLLVFHHNTTEGGFFSSREDAFFSLNNSRFSILSYLNRVPKYQGKYEFILEYPELNGYNRWRQTLNPLFENEEDLSGLKKATGYEPVSIKWTHNYWGGLVASSASCSLLDGSVNHNYWYYAIGHYCSLYRPTTPGPIDMKTSVISLWVRCVSSHFLESSNSSNCEVFSMMKLAYPFHFIILSTLV